MVQDGMATHLRVHHGEKAKEKSNTKTQEAADELAYLMTFSQSHLTGFV